MNNENGASAITRFRLMIELFIHSSTQRQFDFTALAIIDLI